MELDDLLNAMDRTAANLVKLDNVWARAVWFMPAGPARGSNPQYDDLRRAWTDLLPGLPLIDGWTITAPLPDIDEIGQIFITGTSAPPASSPRCWRTTSPAQSRSRANVTD